MKTWISYVPILIIDKLIVLYDISFLPYTDSGSKFVAKLSEKVRIDLEVERLAMPPCH